MGIVHIDWSSIQFDRSSCAWQGGHDNKKRSTRETEKDEERERINGPGFGAVCCAHLSQLKIRILSQMRILSQALIDFRADTRARLQQKFSKTKFSQSKKKRYQCSEKRHQYSEKWFVSGI